MSRCVQLNLRWFLLASLLFLTTETRDLSYNKPIAICGGDSVANWPDISLDIYDLVVPAFTAPLVPATVSTFNSIVTKESGSPLRPPPPVVQLYSNITSFTSYLINCIPEFETRWFSIHLTSLAFLQSRQTDFFGFRSEIHIKLYLKNNILKCCLRK